MWLTNIKSSLWQRELVGGKAFHLCELTRWGFNVPAFGALTTESFKEWSVHKKLPEKTINDIKLSLSDWGDGYFAVRSSMSREDGENSSFAGIFDTFLFTKPSEVLDRIKDCYDSIYSDRSKMYLEKQGLKPEELGVAVVVQKMVDSQSSGVAFSRSPTLNSCLVYIEAGLGLGEGVVSGQVEVDRFWYDRFGQEWKKEINKKTSRILYNSKTHKVGLVEKEDKLSNVSCLTPEQGEDLALKLTEIESHMSKPADVEWAIGPDQKLYILQARAITQKFAELDYYADTNLAESYPGLVSPMTADFIPIIYSKVIGEGVQFLGTTPAKMKEMQPVFDTLIRYFEGHLYYYLNSYYTLLAFLPGGDANIKAWHQMIGGKTTSNSFKIVTKDSLWERLKPNLVLVKLWLTHDSVFNKFIKKNFSELDSWKEKIKNLPDSKAAAGFQHTLIRDVKDWGLTILNDFLVIIGLKILEKTISKYGYGEAQLPELLKTKDGVDSLAALEEMNKLAKNLSKQFLSEFETYKQHEHKDADWDGVYAWLKSQGYNEEIKKIDKYLEIFGDRSFEELKIESMTFSQSPKEFFKILRWSANAGEQKILKPHDSSHNKINYSSFSLKDKIILKIFCHLTSKAVAARESTRLMRGRFYGLLRLCVLKMGELLKKERPDLFGSYIKKDFFNFHLEDVKKYSQGKLTIDAFAEVLKTNIKNWPQKSLDYPEKFCHSTQDNKPYFLMESEVVITSQSDLKGMGASGGSIEGIVLLVSDPREALEISDLEERILVTRSTDPAWIFIMSKCKGLVAEKGSLLSHTAIVGRELQIPTVVGVPHATQILKTGEKIRIDGTQGTIQKLPS
jgi:phosphohistidine swiveling domain-containing protein